MAAGVGDGDGHRHQFGAHADGDLEQQEDADEPSLTMCLVTPRDIRARGAKPSGYTGREVPYLLMAARPMATQTKAHPSWTMSGDELAVVGNSSARAPDTSASPSADTASPTQTVFLIITSVPS